jgi:hypothetical protein
MQCPIQPLLTSVAMYMRDYTQSFGLEIGVDLLATLTHNSWLHLIIVPSLISTLYKSQQQTLSFQSAVSSPVPGNGF